PRAPVGPRRDQLRGGRGGGRAGPRCRASRAAGDAPMTTLATAPDPLHARKAWLPHVDSGIGTLALLIVISALVVLPPFFYLIKSSFTVPLPGFRTAIGLDNYQR